MNPKLSIVVPAFNEALSLEALYERIAGVLREGVEWELVVVSDGSTDDTWKVIEELHRRDPRVRGLQLLVNSGHMKALMAGLDHADGELVITMDADLQHPPELMPEIISQWESGALVVHTIRQDTRRVGWFKLVTSKLYYHVFRLLTGIPIRPGMADFRGLDRSVVRLLREHQEETVPIRFLLAKLSFKAVEIPYKPAPRHAGTTKYTFGRMLRFAVDSLFSFSLVPLYIAYVIGLAFLALFLAYAVYVIYVAVVLHHTVPGWTSLILVVLVASAVQFLLIGVLGGYVGAIHREVKRRPRYVIGNTIGFD